LIILWSYSLVTGFSASVLRAVTMCSFIMLANSAGKHYNAFNILGIAGFVLLMFQPTIIFDVGFQLSFAAVFGIFLIYPATAHLVQTGYKIPDLIWKISCVAFAAQLLTFPMSIYYFNQFPNYFMLSNLAIVPTSTAAMYASLLSLCLNWVPILSEIIGKLTEYSIWLMNKSIFITESLPYATTKFLFINLFETVLIYVMIGLGLIAILNHRKPFYLAAFALAFIYSGGRLVRLTMVNFQQSAIIYRIPGHTLIGYVNGQKGTFLGNKELITNKVKLHYHIDRHISMLGLRDIQYKALPDTNTLIIRQFFGQKSIVIVNHLPNKRISLSEHLKPDIVLFRSLPRPKHMEWLPRVESKVWVVDGFILKPNNWKIISDSKTWNILKNGPYELTFKE